VTYSQVDVLDIVPAIYDAAGEPQKWNDVLIRMCDLFGSHAGALLFRDTNNSELGFGVFHGYSDADERSYREYYTAINPFWSRTDLHSSPGDLVTRKMIIDTPSLQKTEYYNDFALPLKLFDFVAGTLLKQDSVFGMFILFRAPDAPPCQTEEVNLLREFMPHLTRSVQLQTRISTVENKCSALTNAFDGIQRGVILLDTKGQIVFMNSAAQTIMSRKDGLTTNRRKLCARSDYENTLLMRMIQDTALVARGRRCSLSSGNTVVSRTSTGSSYYLTINSMPPASLTGLQDPAVAVFISDPNDAIKTPDTRLKDLFGFTKAEARLSQLLVGGMELREAAEQIGVSYSTVRTQLCRILAKTKTHRQSELIRVLTFAGLGAREEFKRGLTI
jgi:DNA-binding CsgD family transcriptional regulator